AVLPAQCWRKIAEQPLVQRTGELTQSSEASFPCLLLFAFRASGDKTTQRAVVLTRAESVPVNQNCHFRVDDASWNSLEFPAGNLFKHLLVDVFHARTADQFDFRNRSVLVDLELDRWRLFVGFAWKKLVRARRTSFS